MNKINFRVWINLPPIVGAGNNGRYISADRAFRENFIEFEPDGNEIRPKFNDGSVCIEMFTELTDINEKEIYVGDIVKVHSFYQRSDGDGIYEAERTVIGEVRMTPLGVWIECKNNISSGLLIDIGTSFINDELTVIGNIHQNPELL